MLKASHIFKMSVPRRSSAYLTGELIDRLHVERARALLALSHTPVEDKLYQVMLEETASASMNAGAFSVRRLMMLTGMTSYSTVRRARCGLLKKLSIEAHNGSGGGINQERSCFHIFKPEEIFARRRRAGMPMHPHEGEIQQDNASFHRAIRNVANGYELSRREAQVALSCAEGKTNAEIGAHLGVSPETVKFHLRNIFTKFGVRRRTELISRLLMHESE
jgi:DNA-binding CsgD family transcriptional regulator